MRIAIDSERCTGHGRCYVVAPDVCESDDDGYGVVRRELVPPEHEAVARRAAANCPEDAITVGE